MSDPIHDQELAIAIKPMVGVASVVAAAFAAALTLAGAAESTPAGKQLRSCTACTQAPFAMHSGDGTVADPAGTAPSAPKSTTH